MFAQMTLGSLATPLGLFACFAVVLVLAYFGLRAGQEARLRHAARARVPWGIGRRFVGRLAAIAFVAAAVSTAPLAAELSRPTVYVAKVEGMIDLGLAPFVARVLDEAAAASATAVVLEIDTFGGRVDAAVLIRDALLRSRVRTVAFVNKRAISAGALIGLAAETIVMAEGGTIGAATPVLGGEPGAPPQAAAEKTVSYMRKEFAATADARKRPTLLAEAMVDPDVEVAGVIEKGKLLTLTTDEALLHEVADFRANDLTAVLLHLDLANAEVRRPAQSWAEALLRFLTGPVVSSLLLTLGILGIVTELRTPGFGAPGILGVLCLGSFFWGHGLVHLVGWEEVLLVGIGLLLLAFEAFVVPGFGIAGVLGIAALGGGLTLSLLGAGATWASVAGAAWQVALSVGLAIAGTVLLFRFLPRLPFGRSLVLAGGMPSAEGFSSEPAREHDLVGKRGAATSALRPSGFAEIEGERVDVVSEGELIDAGEPIEAIRVDGNRVVVRRVHAPAGKG